MPVVQHSGLLGSLQIVFFIKVASEVASDGAEEPNLDGVTALESMPEHACDSVGGVEAQAPAGASTTVAETQVPTCYARGRENVVSIGGASLCETPVAKPNLLQELPVLERHDDFAATVMATRSHSRSLAHRLPLAARRRPPTHCPLWYRPPGW